MQNKPKKKRTFSKSAKKAGITPFNVLWPMTLVFAALWLMSFMSKASSDQSDRPVVVVVENNTEQTPIVNTPGPAELLCEQALVTLHCAGEAVFTKPVLDSLIQAKKVPCEIIVEEKVKRDVQKKVDKPVIKKNRNKRKPVRKNTAQEPAIAGGWVIKNDKCLPQNQTRVSSTKDTLFFWNDGFSANYKANEIKKMIVSKQKYPTGAIVPGTTGFNYYQAYLSAEAYKNMPQQMLLQDTVPGADTLNIPVHADSVQIEHVFIKHVFNTTDALASNDAVSSTDGKSSTVNHVLIAHTTSNQGFETFSAFAGYEIQNHLSGNSLHAATVTFGT